MDENFGSEMPPPPSDTQGPSDQFQSHENIQTKHSDGNEENNPTEPTSSPPSPKARKLNRRSSIAVARRLSRASTAVSGVAGGGLPLADQLSLLPGPQEASAADRLRQMINVCVRTSCRTIEAEERESGELEDETRTISRSLIDGCTLPPEDIASIASRLETDKPTGKAEDLLTGRARELQEYTKRLEDESKQWKQFLIDRNKTMKIEQNNLKEATKGNIKIEDTQFYHLSAEEKRYLRQLPKIEDVIKSTTEFEQQQTILTQRMAFESNRLRGRLKEISSSLATATRDLADRVSDSGQTDILDLFNIQAEKKTETDLSAQSA